MEAEYESKALALAVAAAELNITVASSTENPTAVEPEEVKSEGQQQTVLKDEEAVSTGNSATEELSTPTHQTCLTVQPNRVLCGVRIT